MKTISLNQPHSTVSDKGELGKHECVHGHAKRVDVGQGRIVGISLQYFRCLLVEEVRTSEGSDLREIATTSCLPACLSVCLVSTRPHHIFHRASPFFAERRYGVGIENLAETEINQCNSVVPVDQDVFQFQVPVSNSLAVDVGQCTDELLHDFSNMVFVQRSEVLSLDVAEEVPAGDVVKDQAEMGGVLVIPIELCNARVLKAATRFYFLPDPILALGLPKPLYNDVL